MAVHPPDPRQSTAFSKGRVERPIGFVRERFWPGRRFIDLRDLNVQARRWQDEFANQRVHEVTGKVPALVFEHEERKLLQPISGKPFETDEIEGTSVTKSFRVSFDRNLYSVPPVLVSQNVVVRANDEVVRIFLGPKEVARHSRCWEVGQVFEDEAHRQAALEMKPGANRDTLSPAIVALGEIGRRYLEVASAGTKSLQRETLRLVFLVELFSASSTSAAMEEVLRTGHVGAEYVEYVLRHKKGLAPSAPPLKLGRPELDDLCFKEPDLAVYDTLFPPSKTVDPGGAPDPENGKGTP